MTTVTNHVWNRILAQLEVDHQELVRGWFGDLSLGRIDGGVVHVLARNQAQATYLEKHCRSAFASAAQSATGRLVTIHFQAVDADRNHDDAHASQINTVVSPGALIADHTFDNFITGPCSRLAHAASRAVVEKHDRQYNPLFLHGPAGSGKTHLLQAIFHAFRRQQPERRCSYLNGEAFVNDFIKAIERGGLDELRLHHRQLDLLVLDDVQYLSRRKRSQEELFNTFNALHQAGVQMVLSAHCRPSEIPDVEDRLISRFHAGLVVPLDPPCLETRVAIIRVRAQLMGIQLPDDVVNLLADRSDVDLHHLERILRTIDSLGRTRSAPITPALAREALSPRPIRPIRLPTILEVAAKRFSVRTTDLQGTKRARAVTFPRHVSMHLARVLTARSLQEIGAYFGGRDHTTVLHASRAIARQAEQEPEFRRLLDEMTQEVKNIRY